MRWMRVIRGPWERPILIVLMNLAVLMPAIAQKGRGEKKLVQLMQQFVEMYNAGDSGAYSSFAKSDLVTGVEPLAFIRGNLDAYHFIGKVKLRDIHVVDANRVEAAVQTEAYDSWWKFSISTDSLHRFRYRTIQPGGFSSRVLKKGKLSNSAISRLTDNYARRLVDSGVFAGSVLIAKDGQIVYSKSFGQSFDGKVNTVSTQYGMASLGKILTSICILKLTEQGSLSLDNTIGSYLPGFKNERILREITIRQLLTHTSGMGDFFESSLYQGHENEFKAISDYSSLLEKDSLSFTPGTKWQYSNSGFVLLSLIIEKLSGKSFDKYVQEVVLAPAGMKSTVVGTGAGGGETTVGDLLGLSKALRQGKLLDKPMNDSLLRYTMDGKWGFGSIHEDFGVEQTFGHGGDFERVCSDFIMYMKSGYTVIVLSNSDPPFAHFVADKIKELLIRK